MGAGNSKPATKVEVTKTVTPPDFEQLAIDANLGHFSSDPPDSVVAAIKKVFQPPVFKHISDEHVKDVYHLLVHVASKSLSAENVEFALALHAAKAKFLADGQCTALLDKMFTTYVSTDAPKMVNMGHERLTLIAAKKNEWKTETNPSKDAWAKAETAIELNLYDLLRVQVRSSDLFKTHLASHVKKARASYYNELLGIDDYDSVDNSQLGYSAYDRGYSDYGFSSHGYDSGYDRGYDRGYIGDGGQSGQWFMEANFAGFIVVLMCLICVGFITIGSCVVGYGIGWYKGEVSVKKRERDYDSVV